MNFSHYKRFREYVTADREFEKQLCNDPENTLKRYKLDPGIEDLEMLRPLWDKAYKQQLEKENGSYPLLEIEKEFASKHKDRILINCLKDESIKNPNYKAWRHRQMERTKSLFHKVHNDRLPHIPFAFELAKGCSGKCPFCALAPPPLEDIFYYTSENAALWKELLQVTKDVLGVVAGASICYWATEPFDNPDYEKFCLDFARFHGHFPQTTTVKHLENVQRTRNFLALSKQHGRDCHRFSIVTLPMLHKLYKEFTPEELAPIEIILNNKESNTLYSNSGRARENRSKKIKKEKVYDEGTSACLSGFLVNMLDRTIKLITPCNPSEKWPVGSIIYEETSFDTASEFKQCITAMIEKYMPLSPQLDDIIAFRPDMHFQTREDGFEVSTKFMTRTFHNSPIVKEMGKIIRNGRHTLQDIVTMFEMSCLPENYIPETIQKMFRVGVLQEPLTKA